MVGQGVWTPLGIDLLRNTGTDPFRDANLTLGVQLLLEVGPYSPL